MNEIRIKSKRIGLTWTNSSSDFRWLQITRMLQYRYKFRFRRVLVRSVDYISIIDRSIGQIYRVLWHEHRLDGFEAALLSFQLDFFLGGGGCWLRYLSGSDARSELAVRAVLDAALGVLEFLKGLARGAHVALAVLPTRHVLLIFFKKQKNPSFPKKKQGTRFRAFEYCTTVALSQTKIIGEQVNKIMVKKRAFVSSRQGSQRLESTVLPSA